MAVPSRIPVPFGLVFPHGAFVIGVEPLGGFDKTPAGGGPAPQARDRDTGEPVWSVKVFDGDPAARTSEVKVKISSPVAPVIPDPMAGTPFRPVEFEGLALVAYVDQRGSFPKVAYSLRAAGMRPAGGPPAGAVRRPGGAVSA